MQSIQNTNGYALNKSEWAKKYNICRAIFNVLFNEKFLIKLNNGKVACTYIDEISTNYAHKIHMIYSWNRCKNINGRKCGLRDKTQTNILNLMKGLKENLPNYLTVYPNFLKNVDELPKKTKIQKPIIHEINLYENSAIEIVDIPKTDIVDTPAFDAVLNAKNIIKTYLNKLENDYNDITNQETILQDNMSIYQKNIADIEIEMINLSEKKKVIFETIQEIKY
jgi:hypothetical protein